MGTNIRKAALRPLLLSEYGVLIRHKHQKPLFATFQKRYSMWWMLCLSKFNSHYIVYGSNLCNCKVSTKLIRRNMRLTLEPPIFSMPTKRGHNNRTPKITYIVNCTLCRIRHVSESYNPTKYRHKSGLRNKENKHVAIFLSMSTTTLPTNTSK